MSRGAVALARYMVALLAVVPAMAAAQSSPSPFTSGTRYDLMHRVVGTIAPDPDGSGPIHYAAARNSYDASGRLIRVEKGELSGWQDETVDPQAWLGFTVFSQVDTTYDGLDRKVSEKVSSGGTAYTLTQYSYDVVGRLECTAVRMNPAAFGSLPASACTLGTQGGQGPDRITKNVYDPVGQLVQVRRAVGTSLEQAYVTYGYTANGKQADIVDANGNHAKMMYDGHDRAALWQFPSASAPGGFNPSTPASALSSAGSVNTNDYESYGYDANDNRTSWRKRDGRVFGFSYDALNRVTVKSVPTSCVSGYACTAAPSWATRSVYYGYDLWGRQTFARYDSTSGTDGVSSGYDGFGRLTSATTAFSGLSRTLTYSYDADGNRASMTWPDGAYVTYNYDGLDRLTSIQENGATTIASMGWDNQGRRAGEVRGSVASAYGYDPISRLASLSDDAPGTAQDLTTTFGYSPAGQMVAKATNSAAYAWTGAVAVNRAYGVNGLNQYTSAGPATFAYDANGNLTSDGSNGYVYDAENRLVTTNAGAALIYDPSGRLLVTSGSAGTTAFFYDGDQLVAESDGSGNLLRRYVHGTGEDDPLIWYEGAGLTDRRSLQTDWQGSIVSIATASGITAINAYDEYGIPNSTNQGRFQYTGQAWLPELGMYYYKARIYSPTLGRFLQTDPIGYKDQMDLYSYVGDDPVDHVDADGNRAATIGERQLLHRAFGGVLDEKAKDFLYIRESVGLEDFLTGHRSHNGPGGYVAFTTSNYHSDFSKIPAEARETFYHEFWHQFEIAIGKTTMFSLFANQTKGGYGSGIYDAKQGSSFWKQNPEARAQIFGVAMATGNFKAMEGVSGAINSSTSFKFANGTLTISKNVTGSLLPEITKIKLGK